MFCWCSHGRRAAQSPTSHVKSLLVLFICVVGCVIVVFIGRLYHMCLAFVSLLFITCSRTAQNPTSHIREFREPGFRCFSAACFARIRRLRRSQQYFWVVSLGGNAQSPQISAISRKTSAKTAQKHVKLLARKMSYLMSRVVFAEGS